MRLAKIWDGPISATLVLHHGQGIEEINKFMSMAHWPVHVYTHLHLLWGNANGNYPVNIARNVAIEGARTKRVFLVDIDFFPHKNIRDTINSGVIDKELRETEEKSLLVFPAFEHPDLRKFKKVYLPDTKREMYEMLKNGELEIFHQRSCPGCHRPSNYSHWFEPETNEAYYVQYKKLYEPYVIGSKDHLVAFDERFVDYGRNKIQLFYYLSLFDFKYKVLPFPFYVIHENHPPTDWAKGFQVDETVKEAAKTLWTDYQAYVKDIDDSLKKDTFNIFTHQELVAKEVTQSKIRAMQTMYQREQEKSNSMMRWMRQVYDSLNNPYQLKLLLHEDSQWIQHIQDLTNMNNSNLLKRTGSIETSEEEVFAEAPGNSSFYFIFSLVCILIITLLYSLFKSVRGKAFEQKLFKSAIMVAVFMSCFIFGYHWITQRNHVPTLHQYKQILSHVEDEPSLKTIIALNSTMFTTWKPDAFMKVYDQVAIQKMSHPAVKAIVMSIPRIMKSPIETVLSKRLIAPSGDKQDFYSRTFYIPGKDGEMHPDVFTNKFDKAALWDLESKAQNLSVMYYLTGKSFYAKRVADMVRQWFVDPTTRMNPHFLFASSDPKSNIPFGRRYGIVEAHPIKNILQSLGLIADSGFWKVEDQEGLENWLADLTLWMMESQFGKGEEHSGNNHQTGYYALLLHFLMAQGKYDLVRRLTDSARYMLVMQFSKDGEQPKELARPDAWWYVGYNLNFMTEIAMIARHVGIDFWDFEYQGRSLKKAIDWIIPYLLQEKKFEYGTHTLTQVDLLINYLPIMRRVANEKKEMQYERYYEKIVKIYDVKEEKEAFYQIISPKER